MCNERERLIGYVYDECSPDERAALQAHLTECVECRQEIAALRAVRQDLLAWQVPAHVPVWRPQATARPGLSWRDVPAWALAAAAGLVLMAGAAGGVAVGAFLRGPSMVPVAVSLAPAAASETATSWTAVDLAALEQRLRDQLQGQMDQELARRAERLAEEQRTALAATRTLAPESVASALAAINARLDRSDQLWRNQALLNADFENRTQRVQNLQQVVTQPQVAPMVLPVGLRANPGR